MTEPVEISNTVDPEVNPGDPPTAAEIASAERTALPAAATLPNGVMDIHAGTGPQIVRHTPWIDLPQDAYPGFKVRIWANMPRQLYTTIFDPKVDENGTAAALMQVVLEHNGWRDYEGRPYPPSTTREFWIGDGSIPTELSAAVMAAIQIAPHQLPNSMRESAGLRPRS